MSKKRTAKQTINQEEINQSKQLLDQWTKLDGELKFNFKELENLHDEIQNRVKDWLETTSAANKKLNENLSVLGRETTVLCQLPEKIGQHLNKLVPEISIEIQKKMFKDCESGIENCNGKVTSLSEKIEA